MKKRERRGGLTWIVVALCLVAGGALSAEGQKDSRAAAVKGLSAPGVLPVVSEKVTLKYMTNKTPDIIDFETNSHTKWMEAQTNVNIKWEQVPSNARAEKVSLVLASGDYPDVFLGMMLSADQELEYGMKQKLLLPLNKLIDKWGVVTKERFKQEPLMRKLSTLMDGEIYALPTWSALDHVQVAQRCWMNTAFLAKLNLQVPKTTDEFYQVLKAFKEKDPNGNGKPDEIPMIGSAATGGAWHGPVDGFLTEAFVYYDGLGGGVTAGTGSRLVVNTQTGKLETILSKPEYREALKYIAKLYKEGLIYNGYLTLGIEQLKQIVNGPAGEIVGSGTWGNLHQVFTVGTDRYRHMSTIEPLLGPKGVRWSFYDPYGNVRRGQYAIAASSKYADVAMKWADYAYTYDATIRLRQGVEGKNWRKANAGEVAFDGVSPASIARLSPWLEEAQNDNWGNTGLWFEPMEIRNTTAMDPNMDLWSPMGLQKFWHVMQKKYWAYIPKQEMLVPPLRFTKEEFDSISIVQTELRNAWDQYKMKFITGALDVNNDAVWDAYVKDLDRLNIQKWLEVANTAFARFKAIKD